MATAQSQYLKIFDAVATVHARWQSYYVATTVTWSSASWIYVPFVADGFTSGIGGDESQVTISAPASRPVVSTFESAIRNAWLAELSIYQFRPQDGNNTPQAEQELIGRYTGQIVGGNGGLSMLSIQLGSALATVGSQVPPRKFNTFMMGKGFRP